MTIIESIQCTLEAHSNKVPVKSVKQEPPQGVQVGHILPGLITGVGVHRYIQNADLPPAARMAIAAGSGLAAYVLAKKTGIGLYAV